MSKTFNMFHFGRGLSPLEEVCMESFVAHGHDLVLHSYEELKVPAGVGLADASRVLPKSELFHFDGSPSAFSNIFRYKLLLENGGWWVDTDVLCLTDSVPDCKYAWANEDSENINGAILKFPRFDKLGKILLETSKIRAENLTAWGQLGPRLLTEVLSDFDPDQHLGNIHLFYPIHWLETHMLWMRNGAQFINTRIEGAMFLHLWNSLFSKMGIDPQKKPPIGSFLEQILGERASSMEIDPRPEPEILDAIKHFLSRHPGPRRRYEEVLKREWTDIFPSQAN